jgi:hypothetical protein
LGAARAALVTLVVGCAIGRAGAALCDLVTLVVGCVATGAALLAIQVLLAAHGEI